MTAPKKTAVAVLALMGAVLGSAVLAERGPGPEGEGRGAMMLDQFDTIDADKDGKITQDEIAAFRAAEFKAADTNGDGALSAEELQAQILKQMVARQSARMIKDRDADGNGSLSAEELGEGPIAAHFARIDTDDDGAISKAEAEAAVERMARHGEGRKHKPDEEN